MPNLSYKLTADSTDFSKAMEDIKSETGNIKKQMRSLTQETNQLEVAYRKLSNQEKQSPFGKHLRAEIDKNIAKLADFKDTVDDIQQEVSKLSNDQAVWEGMSEAISVTKDTVSAFAAALGVSTKEGGFASNAINLLTRAQTFANAAISIGNALQKTSKIVGAITTLQIKMQAAATGQATIAQKAFNAAAKANPYLIVGTALIGLVTALALFTNGAEEATEAQNKLTLAEENGKKASEAYSSTLASEYSKLMSNYSKLKAQWASLANDNQRKKFIKEHKTELESLGAEINNVSDAEGFFKNDTDRVVKAFETRARAAALAAKAAELYRQEMEVIEKAKEWRDSSIYQAGGKVPQSMTGSMYIDQETKYNRTPTYNGGKYYFEGGMYKFTEKGAQEAMKQDLAFKELDRTYNNIQEDIKNVNGDYLQLIQSCNILNGEVTSFTNNVKNNSSAVSKQITTYADAIAEYDRLSQEKQKLNKLLEEGRIDPNFINEFTKEIDNLEVKIEKLGMAWHIKPKIELEPQQDVDVSKIQNILSEALNPEVAGSSLFDFSGLDNFEELEQFKKPAEEIIASMERIEHAKKELEKVMNDKSSSDSQIAAAQDGLENLNTAYDNLMSRAEVYQELSDASDDLAKHNKKVAKSMSEIGDAINAAGQLFGALSDLADKDEGLQVMSIVAKAVATVALSYAQALASCKTWVDWLAFGITGLGTMISMISQIKSVTSGYAEGGVIGGNSFYGDKILARVNSGETILNKRQQQRAWELMDNGISGAQVNVTGVIRGRDLMLVANNESKFASRGGRNISF